MKVIFGATLLILALSGVAQAQSQAPADQPTVKAGEQKGKIEDKKTSADKKDLKKDQADHKDKKEASKDEKEKREDKKESKEQK